MQTQEVAIKPHVKVLMKSDSEMLDEVMVVAYGTAKKSSFTGSASTVRGEKIAKMQTSNVSKSLEGAVAGVQISQSSGQPGASASIFVRGIGSISASRTALIVVDGVPYAIEVLRNAPHTDLSSIALDCGYYDHSHFIKEFKRLAGDVPSYFLTLPNPADEPLTYI